MNDAPDLRAQCLEGVSFFFAIFVPVVCFAHADNDVAKTPLGMVGRNTGP